jgi:hypothetical protein
MRSPYVPTDLETAEFLTDLLVRELRDGRHQLIQDLWIYSPELARALRFSGIVIVPLGKITDYISSRRPFLNLFPKDGPGIWAAVAHDGASQGELIDVAGDPVYLTKQQTDRLFRELMDIPPCNQVVRWKRWVMYRIVKRWGSGAYGGPVPPPPKAAA